ncbi:DUF72 domain-containing protein [Sphingobacterium sp. N143]|uniref:DUF72 domain-containing protein n=1 Tax=Sphingobacterium sp. N143 TaxID=2746727 RepID=UPI0025791A86|nr:DUF72 domain-containing protein [Sphingobacterium sp. N143]MDM1294222.1 DUF72 domain-containing protein [Sphingobacterium sp. N143]
MGQLYFSGTSGILLPYQNKSFYPEHLREKSRLAVYSLLFNSLEVNSSFYKIPQEKTVRRWAQETVDHFRFTFKIWQGITHQKGLDFVPDDVARFLCCVDAVGHKKGCLLLQLPPSTKFTAFINLTKLLTCIFQHKRSAGWHICVEFRHVSWYREEVFALLNAYGMAIVLHDKDGHGLINIQYDQANFIYLRFHGPKGDYGGSYDDVVLNEYSSYINKWLTEGKEVYAYFNNTMGAAIANLETLAAATIGPKPNANQ